MSDKDPKLPAHKTEFEKFRDMAQRILGVSKEETTKHGTPKQATKQMRRKHYLSKSRNYIR